jgi:Abnormal spindle-like microcephaly-assoc'd, ASPM-SPD-2-Hydin
MRANPTETGLGVKPHGLPLALLVLALATVFSSGCVGTAGSNGTSAAGLTATPSSISFGNVDTGNSGIHSVTVANTSAAAVTIANVSVSGAGFNASGLPVGLVLAPGDAGTLAVTFAPSSSGNVSGQVIVTDKLLNSPLPIALSGTGVTPSGHSVTLTWNASTSSVAGYRAYRATAPGGPYSALNSSPNPQLQFKDSTVQPGTTYYYAVTAVAADSAESAYSNQASASVPKP